METVPWDRQNKWSNRFKTSSKFTLQFLLNQLFGKENKTKCTQEPLHKLVTPL